MKKSATKNYIYNMLYEVLVILVPVITTPYVSRTLGAEGIGVYSYTYSIVTYFSLFAALGTTVYGRRESAIRQGDREQLTLLFWEIECFRIISSLVCLIVYVFYSLNSQYFLITIIQSVYILTVAFDVTWFFQGVEDFGKVVFRNTLVKILNIIFIFSLVKSPDDLPMYIFGLAVLPLVGHLITWPTLKKYVDFGFQIKKIHPFRHTKGSFALFIPTIASQVYLLLDKTMIGIFTETAVENGYYEQAQKIVKICWTIVTSLATVMTPRIAYIYANRSKDEVRSAMSKTYNVLWLIACPISFGLFSIADNLVPWFFGPEFTRVSTLLKIFAGIVFFIGLNSITGSQYLVATKKQKVYTFSILCGAILNFGLNMVLIPKYLSMGAAIASVAAECIICVIQIIYVTVFLREIRGSDIFSHAFNYVIAGVCMCVGVRFISLKIPCTMIGTGILIFLGGIFYITILILLRDKFLFEVFRAIKQKIIRRD